MTITGQRVSTLIQCAECREASAVVTELGSPTEGATVLGGVVLVTVPCPCGRVMRTAVKFGGTDQ